MWPVLVREGGGIHITRLDFIAVVDCRMSVVAGSCAVGIFI
jgi:hypothetical protein